LTARVIELIRQPVSTGLFAFSQPAMPSGIA
jgi:hypothetical protein